METNYKENRPWGSFENLLDSELTKVKTIIIKPGEAPSYQYHFKRNEVWVMLQGTGTLILDDVRREVGPTDVIIVKEQEKHQLENTGTVDIIFIEVQRGTYFGEDDIVRLEDKYGRN